MGVEEIIVTVKDDFHVSADAVNTVEQIRVLNHSNTFGIFDRCGNIHPQGKMVQGIYHKGTRYINKLVLEINDKRPLLLSSTIKEQNDILSVDLTNPVFGDNKIAEDTIHIFRNQFLRTSTYHEEINCMNYGDQPCNFDLKLLFNGDFRDIFEIRGIKRKMPANPVRYMVQSDAIVMRYEGLDHVQRQTVIRFTTKIEYALNADKAVFFVNLQPYEQACIQYSIDFQVGNQSRAVPGYKEAKHSIQEELKKSRLLFAHVQTSNEQFNHWIRRSQADLTSLLTKTKCGFYPYAGVPWFNTVFGRDGLITALETLWLAPAISKDVLLFLANKQATHIIPEKDAEPGKILHEMRSGEMANTGEVPFKEYYGTIDATPLFILLAGMYYDRTADRELIKKIWPSIKAALKWINEYGDLDGDGFVEYKHKAKNGLTNQGWKDSYDSIMYANGELAEPPIALCEVQGYVYGAKMHAAKLALLFQETDLSKELMNEAQLLKKNFNEKFWDEASNCFVLALDGKKNPCKVVSSNAGQCLFTRIVDEDKAKKMADVLLEENMFNGWGIKTLSSKERRYNPMSYHNGSVWPHDNALIAYGLSVYGFDEHVLKITKGMFNASLYIDLQRLPELFCGFDRRASEGPTAYPVACSPQAWSVASIFLLIQSCLCLEIDAVQKNITFNKPRLPEYLHRIHIDNLKVNEGSFSFNIASLQTDLGFNVLQKPDQWELIIKK